jgi:hypothetical protein
MSASQSFFARHLIVIHVATWISVIALGVSEGYFLLDLPHPFSVPFTVYISLVGLPFIIIPSFRATTPSVSLESSRKFIRISPWFLTVLWLCFAFVLIAGIIGDIQMRSILQSKP